MADDKPPAVTIPDAKDKNGVSFTDHFYDPWADDE